MNDIMIDLETLDTKPSAVFLTAGIVEFNIETGEFGKGFSLSVDLQSSIDAGRTISADTLKWWLRQSNEALAAILNDSGSLILDAALEEIAGFVENWIDDNWEMIAEKIWLDDE